MNVELDRKSFAAALAILAKAVAKRTTLPEWKAVHFTLAGHTLTARTADGKNCISADLEALSVESAEYPVALVAASDLQKALRKSKDKFVHLIAGKRGDFAYITGTEKPGEAFPCSQYNPEGAYPGPEPSGAAGVTVNLGEFIKGIDSLLPFAEKIGLKSNIYGVRLSVSKKKTEILATDQYRFGMRKIPKAAVGEIKGDPSITIPPHTCEILSEIGKLCDAGDQVKIRVNYACDKNKTNEYHARASFEIGRFTVITGFAFAGPFPSFEKNLPDLQDCFGIGLPVESLHHHLKAAAQKVKAKQPRVTMQFDGVSDACLRFDDASIETGPTLFEAWITYEELRLPKGESRMDDIAFNSSFLAEILAQGPVARDMQIHFNCGQSPALIRFLGDPGSWCLLGPMHLPNIYRNPPEWWIGRRVHTRLDWPDSSAYGIVKSVDTESGEATICATDGETYSYPLARLAVVSRAEYQDYFEAGRGLRETRARAAEREREQLAAAAAR